eukprot:3424003-Alexandrium_andersonii.AAC.1
MLRSDLENPNALNPKRRAEAPTRSRAHSAHACLRWYPLARATNTHDACSADGGLVARATARAANNEDL